MVGTRWPSRLPISPLQAPPDAIPSTGPELHHPISNTTRDGITAPDVQSRDFSIDWRSSPERYYSSIRGRRLFIRPSHSFGKAMGSWLPYGEDFYSWHGRDYPARLWYLAWSRMDESFILLRCFDRSLAVCI